MIALLGVVGPWLLAGAGLGSLWHDLTNLFHPDKASTIGEKLTDWKFWGVIASLVIVVMYASKRIRGGR